MSKDSRAREVDQQAFRFNNRVPMNDVQRFTYVMRKIVGKRLTYAELTGKTEEGPKAEEVPTAASRTKESPRRLTNDAITDPVA